MVHTFVAAGGLNKGFQATYHWTFTNGGVRLVLVVDPVGDWEGIALPRMKVSFCLARQMDRVEWFGLGSGEASSDSRQAARLGLWEMSIDDMQTPYVFPQENGSRADDQWAEIKANDRVMRLEGDPLFALTTRRWSTKQLEAAKHTTDLMPGEHVWVNVDLAQAELGTASYGPGPLDKYMLLPKKPQFSFVIKSVE